MTPIAGSIAPQVVHSMHRMHPETFTRFSASRSMGQRGAVGIALGAGVSAEAQVEYADAVEQRQETPEGAEHLAPGAMNEGHPHEEHHQDDPLDGAQGDRLARDRARRLHGGEWESNPPGTLLSPALVLKTRSATRPPVTSRSAG